jgi:CRP/FNR family transcriptional regulator, cyclic AMP receptor protein
VAKPNIPSWPAHTFLGQLDEGVTTAAVRLGSPCRFPAQEFLLREGERGDHVLLLLSGLVKVLGEAGSRDVLLALRVAGDVVGELAALNGRARIATVVACHVVHARRVAAPVWASFLEDNPPARVALVRVLGDRLRTATQRQVDLSGRRPPVRVARILADLARVHGRPTDHGVEIALALTQPELAGAAGCSEALLRQILKDLRDADIVATAYRRFVILNPDGLARRADLHR